MPQSVCFINVELGLKMMQKLHEIAIFAILNNFIERELDITKVKNCPYRLGYFFNKITVF